MIGMMVRSSGEISKGLDRAAKVRFPAIDILPVRLILGGGFGDTKVISIVHQ